MLTVGQLIELLKEYPDSTEVRIAHQPQWPFQYHIKGVVSDADLTVCQHTADIPVLWLVEGALIDTLAPEVWEAEFRKRCG